MSDDPFESGAVKRLNRLTVAQFAVAAKSGTMAIDAVIADIRDVVSALEATKGSVPENVYLSAVKGRADFRAAFREKRDELRGLAKIDFAYCCGFAAEICDCVNKNHGITYIPVDQVEATLLRATEPSNGGTA